VTAPAGTGSRGRIVAEQDRVAGQLTSDEVRQVVDRYLAAWEVAQLARAILFGGGLTGDAMAQIRASQRGFAGGGTSCTTTAKGIQVRLADPAAPGGYRTGRIRWRLLLQVVADGATPARLADLTKALRDHDQETARQAAAVIVLAGPPATQLDLLDTLDELDRPKPTGPEELNGAANAADPVPSARTRRRPGGSS
jgi:hypothetical protein